MLDKIPPHVMTHDSVSTEQGVKQGFFQSDGK